jgi:hypothetical protein
MMDDEELLIKRTRPYTKLYEELSKVKKNGNRKNIAKESPT